MERWQRNTLIAIALLFAYQTYKVNTTDKVEEPSAFDVCIEENNIAFNFDTLAVQTYEYAIEEMIPKSSIYSLTIVMMGVILLIFLDLNQLSQFII